MNKEATASARSSGSAPTLADVKSAAEDLLRRAGSAELMDSPLFPYGVTQVSVRVRAGDLEVSVEIAGPDHGHEDDDFWPETDVEDLFEDDEIT